MTSGNQATSDPAFDRLNIAVGYKEGVTLFNHSDLVVLMTMPLPGIVIFVHGVNSDGEWYEAAERGLCDGLNTRLRRRDEHLAHHGAEAGQLSPARYLPELTPDGFINPERTAETFVDDGESFSPVIHFRWGYKANGQELQQYGKGLYLNEENHWGGGPFANGCTTLPDLWGEGIEDELFLFLHVQHLNPTNDRNVFSAPPRPYFVLAAYRLAKLIESIRQVQADVPITIVCHSQGTMVGMAAAFLGDTMPDASDGQRTGRCVADSYVLCNSPYSLAETNGAENWAERHMEDRQGRRGRQTLDARTRTLANFFAIVRGQVAAEQAEADVDARMANLAHGFDAHSDRQRHGDGLKPSTRGRVTLYCNPHDRVISAATVQGIGWRGLSLHEIEATQGAGSFCQRVFSQGFVVGARGRYSYWTDQWNSAEMSVDADFWHPRSPPVGYSIRKGFDAAHRDYPGYAPDHSASWGQVFTIGLAPLLIVGLKLSGMQVNALPPRDWTIPITGPNLPTTFLPVALRMGHSTERFDQGTDSPADHRDRNRARAADDPMASGQGMPLGDDTTEASLQYETRAAMRMQAKRDGLYAADADVQEEKRDATQSAAYKQWRYGHVTRSLAANIDTHATDHSTIMTNPMHAEKALAYDVAVGVCDIREPYLRQIRTVADWRLTDQGGDQFKSHAPFAEYFMNGKLNGSALSTWSKESSEATLPQGIVDERDGSAVLTLGKIL